jgi:hypothetical protein
MKDEGSAEILSEHTWLHNLIALSSGQRGRLPGHDGGLRRFLVFLRRSGPCASLGLVLSRQDAQTEHHVKKCATSQGSWICYDSLFHLSTLLKARKQLMSTDLKRNI